MIGKVTVKVNYSDPFLLSGTLPIRLDVRDTSNPVAATRLYSIIADYGWAESILCSESYIGHANAIASIVAGELGIECRLHDPTLGGRGDGDPDAPRHRVDDPATVAEMRKGKGA